MSDKRLTGEITLRPAEGATLAQVGVVLAGQLSLIVTSNTIREIERPSEPPPPKTLSFQEAAELCIAHPEIWAAANLNDKTKIRMALGGVYEFENVNGGCYFRLDDADVTARWTPLVEVD